MSKTIIFQDSYLVSGIMCFDGTDNSTSGCGTMIYSCLDACISECIESNLLPSDARLIIDAEPHGLGIQKLIISIETEQADFIQVNNFHPTLSAKIKGDIPFDVINAEETSSKKSKWTNWINILINLIAIAIIITCALTFPPSILLTVGLTALSFLTTAFTARDYLFAFFRNFQTKSFTNMATTISLGWFLSLGHTLFHSITMPLAASFSMIFMSFIMPLMLIASINGMDEIKRLVMEKSKKIQLKGLKTLFPQMSEQYRCYPLTEEEFTALSHTMTLRLKNSSIVDADDVEQECGSYIQNILDRTKLKIEQKNLLREGMLIKVKAGECFPVDCILVQGHTVIDASLLTGESQQNKQLWQTIPAGAINLSQPVTVYAVKNPYNSAVNSLLFRSNRARETVVSQTKTPIFAYVYTALIVMGMLAAILAPAALGIITWSLVIQNIIGILFSICPCTIAIAHELPKLISIHQRNKNNIHLRDDSLGTDENEIHTVVFDKTGTLTTGNSVLESSDIALHSPLWQRIYLLEKTYGREHPLAKAITQYYEDHSNKKPLFTAINEGKIDEKNRGLMASVQGKMLQLGSYDYLKSNHIILPEMDVLKMRQGFSAVYVAEDGRYQGVIYIQHEIRPGVLAALTRLKEEGKKIIMLTGDNPLSAKGFNQQINGIFDEKHIHAGQTPKNKESFLKNFMSKPGRDPKGVWFCGDGLNDAPCCRIVSEKGGISCAITANDKSAFFTDISLNGSFDYLFKHHKLNRSLKQNIAQNKGILIYSSLAFLTFIISFSIAGIAVSPLIPMAIMLSTTLFILFNAYRTQCIIDNALDTSTAWPKKLLSSNFSLGLLLGASALLICGVLVATIATGGLTLPIFAFTSGIAAAFSSVCTLSAIGLLSVFIILLTTSLLSEKKSAEESTMPMNQNKLKAPWSVPAELISEEKSHVNIFLNKDHSKPLIHENNVYSANGCFL